MAFPGASGGVTPGGWLGGGQTYWDPTQGRYVPGAGPPPPPPGPVQVGPSIQQVLNAGGQYNYARNVPTVGQPATMNVNPPDTYSLPVGMDGGGGGSSASRGVGAYGGGTMGGTLSSELDRFEPMTPLPQQPTYAPPPAPAQVAPLTMPQHPQATAAERKAASDAAYASAKDRTATTGRAALDAFRDEMSSRNLVGSGAEMAGTAGIVNTAQGELGTAAREQSQADYNRANAVADQVYGTESGAATTNYQGNLGQRESDANRAMTKAGTSYQGALTAREQDMAAQQAQRSGRRSSLQVLAGLRPGGIY